jgi:FdhD protein
MTVERLPSPRTTTDRVRVVEVAEMSRRDRPDMVVVEEPLQVFVSAGDERVILGTTMRTPGQDIDLAVGLAVGEGVVRDRDDVAQVRPCSTGQVDAVTVHVRAGVRLPAQQGRVGTVSSACGMCGREAIEEIVTSCPAASHHDPVFARTVLSLPEQLAQGQRVFRRTGGLHAAGIASAAGVVHTVREDVGRHNAVDKAVGAALLAAETTAMLVVSGRAGFEIVQKAAMAGITTVASVSAPTSLAVELARETGILLAGFVRDGRMNLYAGESRLV